MGVAGVIFEPRPPNFENQHNFWRCLSGIKILEDNEDNTGIAIKKLVARMPKWKPGMLDGKYVRTRVVILYQSLSF